MLLNCVIVVVVYPQVQRAVSDALVEVSEEADLLAGRQPPSRVQRLNSALSVAKEVELKTVRRVILLCCRGFR